MSANKNSTTSSNIIDTKAELTELIKRKIDVAVSSLHCFVLLLQPKNEFN